MHSHFNISAHQFFILIILYSVGTVILHTPSPLADIANQDAWLAAILGTCIGLVLVSLYIKVGSIFPNLTLDRVNEKLLGKWGGKIINFTFFFWALLSAGETTFFVGDFFNTFWMPDTPLVALNILYGVIVILAVRVGVESFARSVEILFIPFVLLLIILIISILPQTNIQNIQPVLGEGMKPVLHATFFYVGMFSMSPVMFLMIFPSFINHREAAIKAFYKGTWIGGIILIIIIILNILVLGPESTARHFAPSYTLAKKINVANFLTRIEAIIALVWVITSYIRTVMYFYVAVAVLANIFEIKDHRPLTMPLGIIFIFLSLIVYPDVQAVGQYNKEIWFFYASTYGLIMPILLLSIAKIQKTGKIS
ncbi:spore germination protein KB [Oikeobacillus pervagus]|uniref:Spore germination protein KB n=1 Tax=Oikeobacillus pervagus TaxID=1325931 RepID=A0AAJ1WJM4_9BACI|nr:endospore germination permease [Oikeobacillus pervagus]MDQ0215820.1 spore germination protein KB [Oikeobacillus pervagus]